MGAIQDITSRFAGTITAQAGSDGAKAIANTATREAAGRTFDRLVLSRGALPAVDHAHGEFALGTYNVQNFFDGSTVKLGSVLRKAKPTSQVQSLATSIRQLNADVLGMVEIESEDTLKHFRDGYLGEMGYDHLTVLKVGDHRNMNLGLLSRFPLTNVQLVDMPGPHGETMTRGVLRATATTPSGYEFTVFLAHLKSKLGGEASADQRLSDALQVRRVVRAFERDHPGANYALMGDFNDDPGSKPIQTLLSEDRRYGRMYDTTRSKRMSTYNSLRHHERFDYILLSKGMRNEFEPGSARVLQTDAARRASDHLPLRVLIDGSRDR